MHIDSKSLKPIANLEGQTCFGCGATNPAGLHMEFHTDGNRVCSFVTVPPTMAGWDRTVHGGIISTMLDEIMGWSVIYLLKKVAVTKSITVHFKKPIQVETPLTLVGTIDGDGSGKEVRVIGELYSADEVLCAQAHGVFAALSAQAAVRLGVMQADYLGHFLPLLQQKDD